MVPAFAQIQQNFDLIQLCVDFDFWLALFTANYLSRHSTNIQMPKVCICKPNVFICTVCTNSVSQVLRLPVNTVNTERSERGMVTVQFFNDNLMAHRRKEIPLNLPYKIDGDQSQRYARRNAERWALNTNYNYN